MLVRIRSGVFGVPPGGNVSALVTAESFEKKEEVLSLKFKHSSDIFEVPLENLRLVEAIGSDAGMVKKIMEYLKIVFLTLGGFLFLIGVIHSIKIAVVEKSIVNGMLGFLGIVLVISIIFLIIKQIRFIQLGGMMDTVNNIEFFFQNSEEKNIFNFSEKIEKENAISTVRLPKKGEIAEKTEK